MLIPENGYSVGSRVRVQLHSGDIILAEVKTIADEPSGRRVVVVFGGGIISISPDQITDILS
jgi:hypothetical protein